MGSMDWLRRNWPDLLIGIALVAVIAGIIATLISGGSFFPVGQGSRATTPTTQSSSAAAGSASADAPSSSSAATPSASTPAASTPSATEPGQAAGEDAASAGAVPEAAGDAGDAATPAASTPSASTPADPSASSSDAGAAIAVLPPSDDGDAGSSAANPAASTPSASTPSAASAASSAVAPATSVTASATTDEVSYRVSVGAFGNMENAARLAETFRSAGYPVLMGAQGNLNIVLVGPYATEDEARAVAARIRGGDFGVNDPTVYRFDPAEASDGAATTSPSAASGAAAPAAAASPSASAAAPAATAGRYLQVGAYATRESSLPQRERLEQLGFSVSERVENDLVKLLVGPFDGAALSDAQARLEAAGIESFAR